MSTKQLGPLMGIVFVVLVILSFLVAGESPDLDAPPQEIVSFYVDNDGEQQFAAALLALGSVAFLFFLGTLRRALRAAPGDEGGPSTVVLLGGLMLAVGTSIFAAIGFTLGDAADDLPASAVQTLHAMNQDFFFPGAVGIAAFNLGLALAVFRHGGLPTWIGWLALVVGIVAVTPLGFIAFAATGIVVIAVSIVLMQRTDGPRTDGPREERPAAGV